MKKIFVGPFLGEAGIFLIQMLPYLNGLKKKNYYIVYMGFPEHLVYAQQQKCGNPINEFYPIQWWPSDRSLHKAKSKCIEKIEAMKQISANIHKYDSFINLDDMSDDEFKNLVKCNTAICSRFISFSEQKDCDSVVLFPRINPTKPWTNNRNWHKSKVDEIIKYLSQNYKQVYIGGIRQESARSDAFSNVTYLFDYIDDIRIPKTIEALNNSRFCISNGNAGAFVSIYSGCPTIVFAPIECENYFNSNIEQNGKNFLDTPVKFVDIKQEPIVYIQEFHETHSYVRSQLDFKIVKE